MFWNAKPIATLATPSILMRSAARNDGATTENAIKNPKTTILVCTRRLINNATPWWVRRRHEKRRVNDFLADARLKKRIKIMSARTMFGRSAIPVLMILAQALQAFDKSIGITPSG